MFETGREIDLCVCKGCMYYRRLGSEYACHYAIDTQDVRGMTPSECYKHEGTPYTPARHGKKREKSKFTVKSRKKEKSEIMAKQTYSREVREAAVKAVLVDKEPSEVVRERYCIAKSTLGKWITDAKKEQAKYFTYADSIHLKKATGQDRTGQDRTGQDSGLTAQSVVTEKDGTEDMAKELQQAALDNAADKTLKSFDVDEKTNLSDEELQKAEQEWLRDTLVLPKENEDVKVVRKVIEDRTPAEIMWDLAEEFDCVIYMLDERNLIRSDEKQMLEIIHARCSGFALGLEYGGK